MNQPPFDIFPVIDHKGILLREVQPEDMQVLTPISFYDGISAATVEQAAAMQEKINADYAAGNTVHWVICDLFTNEIVGTLGYYRGFENNAGELGCVLLPAFRGKGYMTMAFDAAIHFGRNIMKLDKIVAITTPENERAIKLMERLNFEQVPHTEEGYIRFERK